MKVVLEVEFRSKVKFPTGVQGAGQNRERMLIDHPESPWTSHAMSWEPTTGMLTVRHRDGYECHVPRENIAWMRFADAAPNAVKKIA